MTMDSLQFIFKAIPFIPLVWGAYLVVTGVLNDKRQSLTAGAVGVLIYFVASLALGASSMLTIPFLGFMTDSMILNSITLFNLALMYSLKEKNTKLFPSTGFCVILLLLIALM